MKSLTKNKQSIETINKMVEKAFSGLSAIKVNELSEGFFNVAYLIELSDKREVILKIAPSSDVIVMTYEKNMMYSEVTSMRMVKRLLEIPIADIIYYDNSHEICESDYFFMNKLRGCSFNSVMENLTECEKANINYQTGAMNLKLNSITGEKFGYFGQADKQGTNWYQVFVRMIEDLIEDAKHFDIDLKTSSDLILNLLNRDKGYFDEVTEPKFVHWDLWAGNVFVVNGEITGIIDFERCMWADELLEVGFRTHEYNEEFIKGYGIEKLSRNQKVRIKWYDAYLYLTVCLESDYRQYDTRDVYNWGTDMLAKCIQDLADRIY